ncbi:MAG: glycosyltransferase, partial [Porphyromonadaceae bacterium]|nr:glycosyltransferase [Porphyromonadaceae bacterium]
QYAIQQYRLEDRVHLLCAVSDVEKASLLQHCRALLQPSIAEGFGLPVVEAMALGKPIFLRPATSLPEVGGDVAYYFDEVSPEAIAGTILSGLSAYDMSPSQAEALRARARLFDYRRMAQGYLQFYHEILSI